MRWRLVRSLSLAAVMLGGCEAPPPPVVTSVTRPDNTPPPPTRPLSVAIAVGTATATPPLVGDYASLMRPRLNTVHQELSQLEQQLAVLQKTPMRMADDDWIDQT